MSYGDAVELIRGPELGAIPYRCNQCRRLQTHAERLPNDGARCVCGARITSADRVEYAGPFVRLVALIIDFGVLVIGYVAVSFINGALSPAFPRDEEGDLTDRTVLVGRIILVVLLLAFFLLWEILGNSPGKRLMGVRVVRPRTGDMPNIITGSIRLLAKVASVGLLGVGFLLMLRDPQRRTLHDRLSGTIVVER
jgi:uncharacterized RDD family membrane protein YckC